jgi:hypothetical protein
LIAPNYSKTAAEIKNISFVETFNFGRRSPLCYGKKAELTHCLATVKVKIVVSFIFTNFYFYQFSLSANIETIDGSKKSERQNSIGTFWQFLYKSYAFASII